MTTSTSARVLFTVDLAAVPAGRRAAEVAALAHALHAEFPAFRLVQWLAADTAAAVVVVADRHTPLRAVGRLTGWGHGRLTLTAPSWDASTACGFGCDGLAG